MITRSEIRISESIHACNGVCDHLFESEHNTQTEASCCSPQTGSSVSKTADFQQRQASPKHVRPSHQELHPIRHFETLNLVGRESPATNALYAIGVLECRREPGIVFECPDESTPAVVAQVDSFDWTSDGD